MLIIRCPFQTKSYALFVFQVLESYLTVKVGEALYDLRERLEKTERKVREVMKEKDRLEKMLEVKVKLIKVCCGLSGISSFLGKSIL